jgi:hypothetical protein
LFDYPPKNENDMGFIWRYMNVSRAIMLWIAFGIIGATLKIMHLPLAESFLLWSLLFMAFALFRGVFILYKKKI